MLSVKAVQRRIDDDIDTRSSEGRQRSRRRKLLPFVRHGSLGLNNHSNSASAHLKDIYFLSVSFTSYSRGIG